MSPEKTICLVDGEHYLPVTKSSVETLNNQENIEVQALVFIGGTEKLKTENEDKYSEMMGFPVYFGEDKKQIPYDLIVKVIKEYNADSVMDLSDEPVLDYSKRFQIASKVLNENVTYKGPDFTFTPFTQKEICTKPSLKIIGTGKRIGKTAVSGYISRLLDKNEYKPCVVAMGRGGPEKPEVVHGDTFKITPEFLMEQANKGVHAASDHWEDALMSRILTIGCRRCGGGMTGEVFQTNMIQGAEIANTVENKFIIFEGSGAAIPPIKTDSTILLIGANQPLMNIEHYFGPLRIMLADLIILTMCEQPMTTPEQVKKIEDYAHKLNPKAKIISTVFRPKPLDNISNKKILFATTAPEQVKDILVEYLEEEYGCKVIGTTSHLSNRPLLQKDIEKYIDDVDLILTELKAAAVDVVTKDSLDAGLDVVYCDNIPIPISNDYPDLKETVLELADNTIEEFNKKE